LIISIRSTKIHIQWSQVNNRTTTRWDCFGPRAKTRSIPPGGLAIVSLRCDRVCGRDGMQTKMRAICNKKINKKNK
jgi:hypothetical protein